MTTVTRQLHFVVHGRRKRVLQGPEPVPEMPTGRIPRVSKLMALAIRFDHLLKKGTLSNQSELATLARVTQPRMTQIMNLNHLAPDIQEAILFLPLVVEGRDPVTERDLRIITCESDWRKQRHMWSMLFAQSDYFAIS